MRHLFLALVMALVPGLLSGQVADTITVEIRGKLTGVMITSELVTPPIVGDSVIFVAEAYDEEGNLMTGGVAFFWASSDPTRLQVTDRPDGSALGVALRQGTVRVWVRAEMVEVMQMASFRDGLLNWSGYDTITRNVDSLGNLIGLPPTLQYCAYLTRSGELVLQSEDPPTCPIVFVAPAEPLNSMWANLNRTRPFESLVALGSMRGTQGSG